MVSETLLSTSFDNKRSHTWVLDSGASRHMSGVIDWFTSLKNIEPLPIRLGDGHVVYAVAMGRIDVYAYDGYKWAPRHLADVLYVPDVKFNLFSMGAALSKNMTFESTKTKCKFYKNNKVVAVGEKYDDDALFTMKLKINKTAGNAFVADNNIDDIKNIDKKVNFNALQLWHERMAHQNYPHIKRFLQENNIKVNKDAPFCEACVLGKMHKRSFPNSNSTTEAVGELVHADLCRPMEERSLGGNRYFLLFKDDYSSYIKIYFLKTIIYKELKKKLARKLIL